MTSETPKEKRESDRLDYFPFAEALAKGIVDSNPDNGLVIGLYGQWGIGKTTILNFIKGEIKKDDKHEKDSIKLVDFNPWWFSGRERIARDLIDVIEDSITGTKDGEKQLKETLDKYSDALCEFVKFGASYLLPPPATSVFKRVIDFLRSFAKTTLAPSDLTTLKKSISDALVKYGYKIIVFMDDIDRLRPDEIVELFTVVKTLADFPNVVYVMAFDRDVVTSAIEKVLFNGEKSAGSKYLEKIVQVEFAMPVVEYSRMKSLLYNEIYSVISKAQFSDTKHWKKIFDSVSSIYKTPREIFRLKNALSITYPSVKDIVCPADFVAIETIRLMFPSLYNQIYLNLPRLVGAMLDVAPRGQDKRQRTDIIEDIYGHCAEEELNKVSSKDTLTHLLQELFPVLGSHIAEKETLVNECRICTCNACLSYFRFSMQYGAICTADIVEDLQDIQNGHRIDTLYTYVCEALQESDIWQFNTICDTIKANMLILSEEKYKDAFYQLFTDDDTFLKEALKMTGGNYYNTAFGLLHDIVTQYQLNITDIFNETLKQSKTISYATAVLFGRGFVGSESEDLFKRGKTSLLQAIEKNPKIDLPFVSEVLPDLAGEYNSQEILRKFTKAHMQDDYEAIKFLSNIMKRASYYEQNLHHVNFIPVFGDDLMNAFFDYNFSLKRLEEIETNPKLKLSDEDRGMVKGAIEFLKTGKKQAAK